MTDDEVFALGKKRAIELGLRPEGYSGVYFSRDVHRLLASGEVMFGAPPDDRGDEYAFGCEKMRSDTDTHSALLIGIKPIKQESLGDKIKSVMSDHAIRNDEALCRIRKLLSEENGK